MSAPKQYREWQVVLAQKVGLVKLGRVGLDGTKVKANASKHKAMSYERMLKAEAELREEIQQPLPPLVEQIQENCGRYPDNLLADAGYWDEDHVEFCEQRGIDPYIATGRLKHGEKPPPIRGRPPKDLDAKGKMYRKLRTKRGREEYARRKVIPEPVFGQRRVGQGFREFLLRGLAGAQGEFAFACACHNLLKIFRGIGAISV